MYLINVLINSSKEKFEMVHDNILLPKFITFPNLVYFSFLLIDIQCQPMIKRFARIESCWTPLPTFKENQDFILATIGNFKRSTLKKSIFNVNYFLFLLDNVKPKFFSCYELMLILKDPAPDSITIELRLRNRFRPVNGIGVHM